jgi:hypothetical protein
MNRDNLKKLIKESIDEVLAEIGAYSDELPDPMDAGEDYFADILEDYKDKLDIKAFKAAVRIIKLRENVDNGELDNILGVLDNN